MHEALLSIGGLWQPDMGPKRDVESPGWVEVNIQYVNINRILYNKKATSSQHLQVFSSFAIQLQSSRAQPHSHGGVRAVEKSHLGPSISHRLLNTMN